MGQQGEPILLYSIARHFRPENLIFTIPAPPGQKKKCTSFEPLKIINGTNIADNGADQPQCLTEKHFLRRV